MPEAPEKVPVAPPKAKAKEDPRPLYWKIVESKKVSVGGVVMQFNKDVILHAAHYSHDGIAGLRRAGLQIVPVEKPDEYE